MKYVMPIAIAAVAFPPAVAPALANPPGAQARTNVPWGTTDSAPAGFGGGEGGPDMRISKEGHSNWPNFRAAIEGSNSVAANRYPNGSNAPVQR